jgi:molecular chaperone Hsp33
MKATHSGALDTVLRAMTDDGAFRVITAVTTETVRGVLESQNVDQKMAGTFADLVTGVILIRETMAPDHRVQGILRRNKQKGTLVADSRPTGDTRGLATFAEGEATFDPGGAILQVMRSLHNGKLHQGMVSVPASGNVSEALMVYMQQSEQIDTMVAVDSVFEDGKLLSAGGYLVQLLPEVGRGPLAIMAERLEEFRSIEPQLRAEDFNPRGLMDELLFGMPFSQLGESPIRYRCWCSHTSVLTALSTLPRNDIDEMVRDGEPLDISCDYCSAQYLVATAELQGLLQQS